MFSDRRTLAISVDPYQTSQNAASAQGLHFATHSASLHTFTGSKMDLLQRNSKDVNINTFTATGEINRYLQTAQIQMSRLIRIYAVWHSVFQLYIQTSFRSIVC